MLAEVVSNSIRCGRLCRRKRMIRGTSIGFCSKQQKLSLSRRVIYWQVTGNVENFLWRSENQAWKKCRERGGYIQEPQLKYHPELVHWGHCSCCLSHQHWVLDTVTAVFLLGTGHSATSYPELCAQRLEPVIWWARLWSISQAQKMSTEHFSFYRRNLFLPTVVKMIRVSSGTLYIYWRWLLSVLFVVVLS